MVIVLEISHATVGYTRDGRVLDDVSLEVTSGSVVALLGPNGAGKTTLLRAASRMLPLQTGSVTLDGKDISGFTTDAASRAGLCHVPEGRGVFPALTVRDNIALFGVGLRSRTAVTRAVEAFPFLQDRLDVAAGSLSGGERQMLALARSWLVQPKVVLLDEVSMGLAPLIVDEVYAFIRRLAARGTSLLLVEQYVDRVRAVADQVHLLRNGQVRFSGPPDRLGTDEEVLGHYLGTELRS